MSNYVCITAEIGKKEMKNLLVIDELYRRNVLVCTCISIQLIQKSIEVQQGIYILMKLDPNEEEEKTLQTAKKNITMSACQNTSIKYERLLKYFLK